MAPRLRFLSLLLFVGTALCGLNGARAAEPAWWTAQKRSCGLPANLVYNSWDGKCASASSGGVQGGGYTQQQQMMLNSAQQMMPLLSDLVHDALYGNPQEQARRAQEAERIRILQQQADEEAERQAELSKQRITALLKGADNYQPLAIKRGDSEGTAPAPASGLALLKLGDASQAPAPAPPGSELLQALRARLDQGAKEQRFLDELLAMLEKSPKADPAVVQEARKKSEANTRELDALAGQIRAAEQGRASTAPRVDSAGYGKGLEAASQCFSQNAGAACAGLGIEQQTACLDGYRAGYQAGETRRQLAMAEAYRAGESAGAGGGLANGASDPRAAGPCRVQWIESYNRGYFESKNAASRR
ncbi:MAG TPA: hypothetical protein VFB08_19155 [Burkholderiales bacterium]|nr:hypothetical protein [Burkholderiales bacterium]